MAVQIASLASGPLPTSKGDLYTSTGVTSIVKSIRLVNTGAVVINVNLYLRRATGDANDRYIAPLNMALAPGVCAIDDQEITMSSGDIIKGDASASGVTYVISGIQR